MRFIRAVITVVTSAAVLATSLTITAGTASADDIVTSSEVAVALNSVDSQSTNNLVAEPAPASTDADSAAVVSQEGMTTEVPKDPSEGVSVQTEGVSEPITIDLPGADEANNGQQLSNGAVAYPSDNGSASAVVATEVGPQMLITIANPEAPTRYDFTVTGPQGSKVELTEDGGAVVLNDSGETVLTVPAPWARDAAEVPVPTHFETDGTTLVQVVEHSENFAYPIVADPLWIAPIVIVAALKAAVYACGAGYLAGMIWHVAWGNSWAWEQIRRSGRQGCIEGVVARFIPWGWIKKALRLK